MAPEQLRRSLARILELMRGDADLLPAGPAELLRLLERREAAIARALAAAEPEAEALEVLARHLPLPRALLFAGLSQLAGLVLIGETAWAQAVHRLARPAAEA